MAATYLQIKKIYGDDLVDFEITITDSAGAAYDLTGLTVAVQYKDADGAWQTVPSSISGDAALGVVLVDWPGTIPAGYWKMRLTVTDGTDLQTLVYGDLVVKAV